MTHRFGVQHIITLTIAVALICGLGFALPPTRLAWAASDYGAWNDLGIVYTAPSGRAYYPSVVYDANGFGSGSRLYKMWYSNGSGGIFVITSTNGFSWSAPTAVSGLHAGAHHVQVVYDANCFGTLPCTASTTKYKMWYWIGTMTYAITDLATAQSTDGITWTNDTTLTQSVSAPLVTGAGVGWNRGSYGLSQIIYQVGASNSGTEPWNYSYVADYDGTDGSSEVTGLAYSADGLYWTAYASTPVLDKGAGNAWDCDDAVYGTVYHDAAGYHYWYSGGGGDNGSGGCLTGAPNNQGIGLASSSDGKVWTKSSTNPIFHISQGVSYRNQRVYTPNVVDDGSGVLKMYYSALGTSGVYQIGLAVNALTPQTVFVDDDWIGLSSLTQVTFPGDPDPHVIGVDAFATIQAGVNAVASGGTVKVATGTYAEQVAITQRLTLIGVGSPTIQEPVTLLDSEDCSSWGVGNRKSLITISGVGVNVEVAGFTLNGMNGTTLNAAIYVRGGATANIHDNTLANLGTSDTNLGMIVGRNSCHTTGIATVARNVIGGYGKGGVVVDGIGSSATIITNTITGAGATANAAQNGIQISRGASATISGNTISGHICTQVAGGCTDDPRVSLTADGAAGILLYASGPGVTITNNLLDQNQFGIWTVAAVNAVITGNTLTGTTTTGITTTGIAIWDSDQWTTGMGYAPAGTTAYLANNTLTNHGYGLLVRDYDPGGVAPIVQAFDNSISSTVYGVWSDVALDASNNWWGTHVAAGVAATVNSTVDYTPWFDSGADTSTNPGFQGDFSTLWVSAASPQSGSRGRIQEGADRVATNGMVNVIAGTYTENITLTKALQLLGPNTNIDPNIAARQPEAVIVPQVGGVSSNASGQTIINLDAPGITLDGFTLDGDNPALNTGNVFNGADVDVDFGIINNYADATLPNLNATISHNIIKNINDFGVYLYSNGTGTTNNTVSHNQVDNILGAYGQGIRLSDNAFGNVTDNVVTRARNAIVIENFSSNTAGTVSTVSRNTITAVRRGIRFNLHYNYTTGGFTLSDNQIASYVQSLPVPQGLSTLWVGIEVESIQLQVPVTVTRNIVTGHHLALMGNGYTKIYGTRVTNASTTSPHISLTNNTLTDAIVGLLNETPANVTVQQSTLTANDVGVSATAGGLRLTGNTLNNNPIVFDQSGGTLLAYANSIGNFTTGLNSSGGTANLKHNWWGTYVDPAPSGLSASDWQARLGAPIQAWIDGANAVTLGSANLSGGVGTAVIVDHGRGSANAPFGNGIAPYANNMCSDYYDFFTVNGSGSWTVSVPVDNTAACNSQTLDPGKVFWIPYTTNYGVECTANNGACWDLVATNVITSGQNIVVSNLSVAELGGTPFVAGSTTGTDPTAVALVSLEVVPLENTTVMLPAITALFAGLFGSALLVIRRKR
ncbi:MAG TPA: right-handed parallel beta-helix repeat-containing protein, partial [Anaerolineae bacterium]|nr:right-handed parallel beta-helix repeat-containing protein [Anaerolineae bacterium]